MSVDFDPLVRNELVLCCYFGWVPQMYKNLFSTYSHCTFSSNLFHRQIVQKHVNQLRHPENNKCSPCSKDEGFERSLSKNFSRATFFVFWVSELVNMFLNNLLVKQI